MTTLLNDVTCWQTSAVTELALLVDGEIYYSAFVSAARKAKRSILLSGWQFDTTVGLLRDPNPTDGGDVFAPRFLHFLSELCAHNDQLQVHILAWDYSVVYAVEREWMQKLKMTMKCHERVHFEFWTHPNRGGSHHHKYAVIDDQVAFVGGLDICDSRWDQRSHPANSELRRDVSGDPYKPFHDLQVAMRGPAVSDIREIFSTFWREVEGAPLGDLGELNQEEGSKFSLSALAPQGILLPSEKVGISRTDYRDERTVIDEVRRLLTAAICSAESHIYIENQYLTSRAILAAFRDRLEDESRDRLDVVIVMPDGADTPKEDFVLGDRQRTIRYGIMKLAHDHGHRVRFVVSSDRSNPQESVSTFIHAKLLIVDDRFLSVGSANLTNRSMQVDTELNISVEQESGGAVSVEIRQIRASLLAEHAGIEDLDAFLDPKRMIDAVDRCINDTSSKMHSLDVEKPEEDDPLLIAIFDPSGELSSDTVGDALQEEVGWNDSALKNLIRKAGQRLGVIDTD